MSDELIKRLKGAVGEHDSVYLAIRCREAADTIERLTRELDETRAEVTRLNALINTPQPVITGIWRRSVI